MDFDLTPEQRLLVRSVEDFVQREAPVSRARALREDARGFEPAHWRTMGELGWLGVAFPEHVGGADGAMVDVALLLEVLGRSIVPEPYLASVLLAGTVLLHAGSPEQRERFLVPMLAGEKTLALAHDEPGGRYGTEPRCTQGRRHGACLVLDGDKRWVLNGHAADEILVSFLLEGAPALAIVNPSRDGVTRTPVKTIDGRRAAHMTFKNVVLPISQCLVRGSAREALELGYDRAAAGAVAMGLGGAETMLQMTVQYLKTRHQFGRALGSFQSLQHRAAQMFIELELLRSSSLQAMVLVDDATAQVRRRAVSAAKVQLSESGRYIARQSVQLHGGVGVTDEHDLGLFYKRQLALEVLFGDAQWHLERFVASETTD